jgi:hypothetical protein
VQFQNSVWYGSAFLVEQLPFDFSSSSNFTGEVKVVSEKRLVKQFFIVDRRQEDERSKIFQLRPMSIPCETRF